jgi:hypothetical protein
MEFKPSGKQINKKEKLFLESLNLRWCAKCQKVQDPSEFHKNAHSCRSCKKSQMDSWKSKNENYHVKYREENKEKRNSYNKQWASENKEKIRERKKVYRAIQRKTNSQYRIVNSLRCRVHWLLKNKTKAAPTLDMLGCSLSEFILHLESQFAEGMTWDNYGNPNGDHSLCWHIDHIKPCASFDLTQESEQKKCFHYSNLQPLWGIENIKKGSKY